MRGLLSGVIALGAGVLVGGSLGVLAGKQARGSRARFVAYNLVIGLATLTAAVVGERSGATGLALFAVAMLGAALIGLRHGYLEPFGRLLASTELEKPAGSTSDDADVPSGAPGPAADDTRAS